MFKHGVANCQYNDHCLMATTFQTRPFTEAPVAQAFPDDPILSIHPSSCCWILDVPSSITCVNGTLPVFSAMYVL